MMAHRNKHDIREALDKAAGGADSNPVTRVLVSSGPHYKMARNTVAIRKQHQR
jgi:hypothetical protein